MVWDGDCNFCRFWVRKLQRRTGEALACLEYQNPHVAELAPEIPRQQFEEAVQLILPDGRVLSGAEAAFVALRNYANVALPFFLFERLPGAALIANGAYRFVASHRMFFSRLTRLAWGKDPEPSNYARTSYIFVRALALIYLVAFASLASQLIGLAGQNGVVPANQFMLQIKTFCDQNQIGISRYFQVPTLCWLGATDGWLRGLGLAGISASALLLLGVLPRLMLIFCWALYLSLAAVSGVFLQFQWDILLLETGLLTIFLAPWTWFSHPAKGPPPSLLALWLLRWLLFRLMFQSGCVKLLSGDPLWHKLTALQVHFETQPLPTWIGWYAHQLPGWFLKASCALMFFVELVIPFLIFCPPRLRRWAFWPLVSLQIVILLTGNYCFFNWLAIALCLLLLDDAALPKFRTTKPFVPDRQRLSLFTKIPLVALTSIIVVLTSAQLLQMFKVRWIWSRPVVALYEAVAPFRSINSYGLFAVMTRSRPEIIVEGSADGRDWKAYRFKYKPQELNQPPGFVAPHQPRVDWQMWFAALGNYGQNPWFINFCLRLIEGRPEVLRLIEFNPFPEKPPAYVRALTYDYRFTRLTNSLVPTVWWTRTPAGEYLPPITLRAKE